MNYFFEEVNIKIIVKVIKKMAEPILLQVERLGSVKKKKINKR